MKKVLKWAVEQDKFIITLCHGPASLLAAAVDEQPENYIFKDYQICVFPDSLDKERILILVTCLELYRG